MQGSDNADRDGTFTFFSEKESVTVVEQFAAASLERAIDEWYGSSRVCPAGRREGGEPVEITGTANVWCITGRDAKDEFILGHVVETAFVEVSLFTFHTEIRGSTLIEQLSGHDVEVALVRWLSESEALPNELIGKAPLAEKALKGVWRVLGKTRDGSLFLTHIVSTASMPILDS